MTRERRLTCESADALRAKYEALRHRVLSSPPLAGLMVSDMKAPVQHVSTLRYIALQQGLMTLRQVIDEAAANGVVPFDVERGVTLARTIEYLLERAARCDKRTIDRRSPTTDNLAPITSTIGCGSDEDARDSLDEFLDAADALREAVARNGVSDWAARTIHQHIIRITCSVYRPTGHITRSTCMQLATRSLYRLKEGIGGEQGQLRADLADAMSLFGDRDARFAQALTGVDSLKSSTLEEVGKQEGLSRERVRQIFSRFLSRAGNWHPPLVSLALLQAAVDRAGRVITDFELRAVLPAGILSTIEDLGILNGLLRLGWIHRLTTSRFAGVWVHSSEDLPNLEQMAAQIRRRANRSLRRWGALEIAAYEDLAGDDGIGLLHCLILRDRPLDVIEGWAVIRKAQRTMLADRVRRIAEVTPVLPQGRMGRALKKSLRSLPPDPVWLAALQRDVPTARVSDQDTVRLSREGENPLSGSEILAQRLIREQGGATTLRTLQRLFVREGMSAGSAGVAFTRSPVLERFGPGVIGIIGRDADQSHIASVRRKLKRESARSLIGFRRHKDAVEVMYKLDPDLISSTLFLLPRDLVALGEWRLESYTGRVVVKKSYVSGLHRIAKMCVNGGSKRLSVVFRTDARTVQISPR